MRTAFSRDALLRTPRWCQARRATARAFTLVEAVVALTITAIAAAALFLTLDASLQTTTVASERAIADGLARQLLDEIMGQRHHAPGSDPYQFPLEPSPLESQGPGRRLFNDSGDYHLYQTAGAEDLFGNPLGHGDEAGGLRHPSFRLTSDYFHNWGQKVEVYYVDENDHSRRLPDFQTSNFRAAEITIFRITPENKIVELARKRQVFAYVTSPL